tara:strand:- start:223 stop:732 length:510 start_codon:yes stop_codon:yes gene_type:complete
MDTCSICLDEINNTVTDCNHSFCKGCIDEWFKKGRKDCPMCRSVINEIFINSEKTKIYFYKDNGTNNTIIPNNNNTENYVNYRYYRNINYILWLLMIYELYSNFVKTYQINDRDILLNICSKTLTNYTNEYNACFEKESDLTIFYIYIHDKIKTCYAPAYYINSCVGNK